MTLTGTKLGRYEILSKIGVGGMGEVYLAEDTKLNRRVAIKFLPTESLGNEQANQRLLREAQAAAKLDHPNICAVHEVAEERGHMFIVMPYVEGETLDGRMKRKPLVLSESLEIAAQISDALADAHAHGIVHRDIKPANLIITPRGQVKVMDFGLAKLANRTNAEDALKVDAEATTLAPLTTPGTILGTVPYMSPEQVHGHSLDALTDIFSFGVVLYEMLTRRQPFTAESQAGTISAILTREPPPVSDYLTPCPPVLPELVSKCLEKDRERRYQNMREVLNGLENVRRQYASGTGLSPTSERNASSPVKVADSAAAGPVLINGGRLALIAVVVLTIILSIYAIFIRGSHNPATPTGISVNSPAYDFYLRGKVNADSENRENNASAISLLEQAIAADPNFAPAYAELARAYNIKARFYFSSDAEKKKLDENAEVAVDKALTLNPNLAEAHYARGLLLWTPSKGFPHEQAIQSYKQAITLNPNLDDAHHQLGQVYYHIGLFDKGRDELEKALAINPANTLARFRLGIIDSYSGKYEEALSIFKSIPRESNPSLVNRATAGALFELGRTEEASALVEDYFKTYTTDEGGAMTSMKAMLLAKAGREHESEEAIQHAIEIGKGFGHFHHTAYNIALAYALMNKPELAVQWLQITADGGFPCYPLFENDASLNNVRKDERFNAFMAKLKQQWERYNSTL
jgi:serine/threonine protein kinase/thioredoxin-like negative regulator of GroEL